VRVFGLEITKASARAIAGSSAARGTPAILTPVDRGGRAGVWLPIIVHEPTTGGWQRNEIESPDTLLSFFAVYACHTLICDDMAKMRWQLVALNEDTDVWEAQKRSPWGPILRRPNNYQNRPQFVSWWMSSKLAWGNTYALKQRDARGLVSAAYILDPCRVTVLVAPDRSVFYELKIDNLAGLTEPVVVPAREIFHDRNCPLFHPLCGVSPLYAASLPALQGLKIERNSHDFFANGSQPGGVLTAPGFISQEAADRAKERWEEEFGGPESAGTIAVLGDGLKYEPMGQTALNSQLIEQLKFTAEMVCACYHVAPYLIGIGPQPTYTNPEALQQMYLAQCLQIHIKEFQKVWSEGLELPIDQAVHFDLEDLLQMDTATKMTTAVNGVNAAVLTPNEARRKFNLPPKDGGDSPYLQQQYYSLEALDRRDSAPPTPPIAPTPPEPEPDDELEPDPAALTEKVLLLTRKAWLNEAVKAMGSSI